MTSGSHLFRVFWIKQTNQSAPPRRTCGPHFWQEYGHKSPLLCSLQICGRITIYSIPVWFCPSGLISTLCSPLYICKATKLYSPCWAHPYPGTCLGSTSHSILVSRNSWQCWKESCSCAWPDHWNKQAEAQPGKHGQEMIVQLWLFTFSYTRKASINSLWET